MKKFLVLFLALVLFSGCSQTASKLGLLYTDISYPLLSTDNTETPKSVTISNHSILGLFVFGDASLDKAKKKGNIKKVSHIDANEFIILGVYRKYTITVYGE